MQPASHLNGRNDGRLDVGAAHLDQHPRVGRGQRREDDPEAGPECQRPTDAQLAGADDGDAYHPQHHPRDFRQSEPLGGQVSVGQRKPEQWYRGTEDGRQPGGDVLLAPEYQGVVEGNSEQRGVAEQVPVAGGPGKPHPRAPQ